MEEVRNEEAEVVPRLAPGSGSQSELMRGRRAVVKVEVWRVNSRAWARGVSSETERYENPRRRESRWEISADSGVGRALAVAIDGRGRGLVGVNLSADLPSLEARSRSNTASQVLARVIMAIMNDFWR